MLLIDSISVLLIASTVVLSIYFGIFIDKLFKNQS